MILNLNLRKFILKHFFNQSILGDFENWENMPRYTKCTVMLNGKKIEIADNASFKFMHKEIFKQEIYKFNCNKESPLIIDGGANIGLATIYFKQLFPKSKIIAFEPDKEIFELLKMNIGSFNLDRIELINKGLWHKNTTLPFTPEGADAGFITELYNSTEGKEKVNVVSLKPYLKQNVDFLKLDIEGAETVVLQNIKDELDNVERIFVEYHSFVGKEQTLNELINILAEANFRLYVSSPGVSSKSPFVKISKYNNMDMQLNIYGFKN